MHYLKLSCFMLADVAFQGAFRYSLMKYAFVQLDV